MLLTTTEVARTFNLEVGTVYNLFKSGHMPRPTHTTTLFYKGEPYESKKSKYTPSEARAAAMAYLDYLEERRKHYTEQINSVRDRIENTTFNL